VTGAREPRRRLATKSAEALARRIEAEIVADGWQVGQLIGTEPELLALYGVSRPVLREAGMLFVGLDVIGGYVTEINVTSPTGVRELDKAFGLDIGSLLIDAIARRLSARPA